MSSLFGEIVKKTGKAVGEAAGSLLRGLVGLEDGQKQAFGKARFMPFGKQIIRFGPWNKGLKLGWRRLTHKRSHQGSVIIAPVGFGKTSMLVIPQILKNDGSFIVTDPSGEIEKLTAGHLQERGFRIQVLNTERIDRSLGYNPLCRVKGPVEAKQIADTLIQAAYPNPGDDAFWNQGGAGILSVLIQILKGENPQYFNLANLRYLLNSFGENGENLQALFDKQTDPMLKSEIEGFISQERKIMSSFLSTAKVALDKIADPDVAKLTSGHGPQLDIEAIRKEQTAIFIQAREDKIQYHSFLFKMLYTHIFEHLMEMPEKGDLPVTILLEEAGNIGALPNFSSYATTIRKRRASLVLILQELSQLEMLYGQEGARTILEGGLVNRVYFPGLSQQTCKELEATLGMTTVQYKHPGSDGQWQATHRPLMTADEIRQMKFGEVLYLYANEEPVKLSLTPWFKSWRMRSQCGKTAPEHYTGLSDIPLPFIPLPEKAESGEQDGVSKEGGKSPKRDKDYFDKLLDDFDIDV